MILRSSLRRWIQDEETADDLINAAELLLTENPFIGKLIDAEARIYSLALPPIGNRGIQLFYTFTPTTVFFLWIAAYD